MKKYKINILHSIQYIKYLHNGNHRIYRKIHQVYIYSINHNLAVKAIHTSCFYADSTQCSLCGIKSSYDLEKQNLKLSSLCQHNGSTEGGSGGTTAALHYAVTGEAWTSLTISLSQTLYNLAMGNMAYIYLKLYMWLTVEVFYWNWKGRGHRKLWVLDAV